MGTHLAVLVQRWRSVSPLIVIAIGYVIMGGAIAAAIAHHPSETGVWAVAYLVLVGGVTQAALGLGQAVLARYEPPPIITIVELAGFNLGNLLVIGGVVFDRSWSVDIGGILLVATLAVYLRTVWGMSRSWLAIAYQALLAFILGCISVGLVLARVLN